MEIYGSGVAAAVLAIVLLVAALVLLLLLLLFVLIRLHIKHDGCAGAPFTLMETMMIMGVRNYHDVLLDKAPGELVLGGGSAGAVFCCSNCE